MTAAASATVRARRPRVVTAALLACVLGALAFLSGCNSNSVVAYVDGNAILTKESLARIEPGILELLGEEDRQAVITVVVTGEIAPAIAKANGVELTVEQLAEIEKESAAVADPEARAVMSKFYQAYLIYQTLGQRDPNLWTAGMAKADVEVNPRYGSWVLAGGGFVVQPGGSLSEPTADPSAEATAQQGG